MVAKRDAHARRKNEEEKESDLEEIQAVLPNIKRNSCASDDESSDEEDAVSDSNFAEDFFHYQELGEAKVRRRGAFTVLPELRTVKHLRGFRDFCKCRVLQRTVEPLRFTV